MRSSAQLPYYLIKSLKDISAQLPSSGHCVRFINSVIFNDKLKLSLFKRGTLYLNFDISVVHRRNTV